MTPSFQRVAALVALLLMGTDALADRTTCQSRNQKREDCTLRGRGEVVLVRQISSTTCVKGKNWEETRQGLSVTDGCGGVFETRDSGNGRPDERSDPGGGWSGGSGRGHGQENGQGAGDHRDLVGVRASSGELELRRRGLRDVRSDTVPGGRLMFWRTPSGGCVEVQVADGRYQRIRPVDKRACEAERPVPPDRPMPGDHSGQPPPQAVSSCLQQFSNDEAGHEVSIESQSRLRSGGWELKMLFAGRRFNCIINAQGQVIEYPQIR